MKKIFISLIILLIFPTTSFAYLGPGIGIGILAATLGIIIAILAAIFGMIWFPVKKLLKKKKRKK